MYQVFLCHTKGFTTQVAHRHTIHAVEGSLMEITDPHIPGPAAASAEGLAHAALLAAPLYVRQPDDACAAAFWNDPTVGAIAAAHGMAAPREGGTRGWHALGTTVLEGGMPLAALPVESLYKPWNGRTGSPKGMYLGPSATQMTALFRALDLELPQEFSAMPDHLSLLLETLSVFLDAHNVSEAAEFARAHLDWLADYRGALEDRQARLAWALENGTYDPELGEPLSCAIASLKQATLVVDYALRDVLEPRGVIE